MKSKALLKGLTTSLIALLAHAPSAPAMEADKAKDVLVGSWSGPRETWIFEANGAWTQYIGGAVYKSEYELSEMPARMVRLKSSTTGKSYVFHLSPDTPVSMSVYEEGKTELVTYLTKLD